MKTLLRRREVWLAAVLASALGTVACFVSNNLHPRFEHRAESIESQQAILAGRPYHLDGEPVFFPMFQNRVLFPLALAAAVRAGVRPGPAFLLLRWTTFALVFFLSILAFVRYLRAPPKVAGAGALLLAVGLVPAFNHGWEITSDALDLLFTVGFVVFALEGSRARISVLALIACANRESAVFSGVIWAAVRGKKEIPFGAVLSAACYAVVAGLRRLTIGASHWEGVRQQSFTPGENLSLLGHALRGPSPSSWLVLLAAMFAPAVVWLLLDRERIDGPGRRLVACAGVLGAASLVFGLAEELRIFLPAFGVLACACVRTEALARS